jgi:hypothetical protein
MVNQSQSSKNAARCEAPAAFHIVTSSILPRLAFRCRSWRGTRSSDKITWPYLRLKFPYVSRANHLFTFGPFTLSISEQKPGERWKCIFDLVELSESEQIAAALYTFSLVNLSLVNLYAPEDWRQRQLPETRELGSRLGFHDFTHSGRSSLHILLCEDNAGYY